MDSHIEGTFIKDHRFQIGKFLDSGSFGRVYEVKDLENPSRNLVVKVCINKSDLFKKEIKLLVKASDVVAYGKLPNG